MSKIIINFCPTGMVPTKDMTPHVPISPSEIIEQTHEAYEVGITIAHLHAREKDGIPTYKSSIYQEIFEGVRKHCPDLVICGSSSGRNFPEFEKRSELLELQPDMCSLTLSSLNFLKQTSVNSPDIIIGLANKMKENGVIPELECFDLGMINFGKYLIQKEIIEGPYYWNLLFGNIAGFQAKLSHVATALEEIPSDHYVSLAGLGKYQLSINSMAISQGLGVRVGLEDNIWWNRAKDQKATNIQLVKRVHELIKLNQKTFMEPKEFGRLGFYNTLKQVEF
ncbi:MAG: 3-keto-5-aminohexanoate cleavage protein [Cyclobacteriaceae bacterium]|nr:3-keto-5-aminohexanoate cleavage protein [Cyclobacteriaceae bacterium]